MGKKKAKAKNGRCVDFQGHERPKEGSRRNKRKRERKKERKKKRKEKEEEGGRATIKMEAKEKDLWPQCAKVERTVDPLTFSSNLLLRQL